MQWENVRTRSGLKIFRPQTFESLATSTQIEAARKALVEEGIVVVTSVLEPESISEMKSSLVDDYLKATAFYRMNELTREVPRHRITSDQVASEHGLLEPYYCFQKTRIERGIAMTSVRMAFEGCSSDNSVA